MATRSRGRARMDDASRPGRGADAPLSGASGEVSDHVFEVRVAGLVPDALLSRLGGVEITGQELRTVLTGSFQDQAELYGFLSRLRSLHLDVVEVRRVAGGGVESSEGEGRDGAP